MKQSLVSIIVPIYNAEVYLNKCVESLVNQSYDNLEIVLIDDGSTDKSLRICEIWKQKDPRIKVFHKELDHVCEARNLGLSVCTGDYISWCDSDDYFEPNAIEFMLDAMDGNTDVVCSNYYEHKSAGLYPMPKLKDNCLSGRKAASRLFGDYYGGTALWNKLIKRNLCQGLSFKRISGRFSEDSLWLMEVYFRAKEVKYINSYTYHYFIRSKSTTHGSVLDQKRANALIASIVKIAETVDFYSVEYSEDSALIKLSLLKYVFWLEYALYFEHYTALIGKCDLVIKSLAGDDCVQRLRGSQRMEIIHKMILLHFPILLIKTVKKILLVDYK